MPLNATDYYLYVADDVIAGIKLAKHYVNDSCSHLEQWEIILYSVFTTYVMLWLKDKVFNNEAGDDSFLHRLFRCIRKLPVIKVFVEKKMKSIRIEVEEQLNKGLESKVFLQEIPKKGWTQEKIFMELKLYLAFGKYSWEEGRVSGAVYHGNDETLNQLVADVFRITAYHNPLHPDVFPAIRLMEAEVIRIVCTLFNGDKSSCGTLTTGGTESIFLACKAYRDYAVSVKGIRCPNMVIPVTAHAAFDKAAQILKIKVKHISVDPTTTKVNMKAMKKAIDANTCMLVGSSPAFPHGSIDPIEEIAKLGCKYNIPVHVDACLGGFLVPFMKKAGFETCSFDFSVPGVTSISADTHKYAYAPKGSSVLLYRSEFYRHYQYSVQPNWPGGIYGTTSISGSRSGGIIATCWATLLYHGEDFYIDATKKIVSVAKYIEKGVRAVPGIFVIGKPDVSIVAIGSDDIDIYCLSASLTKRGWSLNVLQFPPGFHFCVTLQHTQVGVADKFLSDLSECTEEMMKEPKQKAQGAAAVYGLAQQIPDRSLVSELVWSFLDACTSSENGKAKMEISDNIEGI